MAKLRAVLTENSGISLGVAGFLAIGLVGYGVLYADVQTLKTKQVSIESMAADLAVVRTKVEDIEKTLDRRLK